MPYPYLYMQHQQQQEELAAVHTHSAEEWHDAQRTAQKIQMHF
jgi:hypothetical protein